LHFLGTPQTLLFGAFRGYLINVDLPLDASDDTRHFTVERMALINDWQEKGSGCVRVIHGLHALIKDCYLRALRPITMFAVIDAQVRNCMFNCSDRNPIQVPLEFHRLHDGTTGSSIAATSMGSIMRSV